MLKGWISLVTAFTHADMIPLAGVPSIAFVLTIVVYADHAGDIFSSASSCITSGRGYNPDYWGLQHAALPSDRDSLVGIKYNSSSNGLLMPAKRQSEDASLPDVRVVKLHDLCVEVHYCGDEKRELILVVMAQNASVV